MAALFAGLTGGPVAAQAWQVAAPSSAVRTGSFANPSIGESSGIAASRRQPGILWTVNDSGNPAVIFAFDSSGRDLGAWQVSGAVNADWEEVSLGPCPAGSCLYIADTGDNGERRSTVTLYRVVEPTVSRVGRVRGPNRTEPAERVDVTYPDGAHDVEAMYVDAGTRVNLITKGRSGGVRRYQLPPWPTRFPASVVAVGQERLPIPVNASSGRLVTAAALAPDGKQVAVRTYRDVYFLQRRPGGDLIPGQPPIACTILGLEPQGEGIDWLNSRTLILTSESAPATAGTITVIRCPGI